MKLEDLFDFARAHTKPAKNAHIANKLFPNMAKRRPILVGNNADFLRKAILNVVDFEIFDTRQLEKMCTRDQKLFHQLAFARRQSIFFSLPSNP